MKYINKFMAFLGESCITCIELEGKIFFVAREKKKTENSEKTLGVRLRVNNKVNAHKILMQSLGLNLGQIGGESSELLHHAGLLLAFLLIVLGLLFSEFVPPINLPCHAL